LQSSPSVSDVNQPVLNNVVLLELRVLVALKTEQLEGD
jgi:hypothetical protein